MALIEMYIKESLVKSFQQSAHFLQISIGNLGSASVYMPFVI
jgi:hypothetical protein